MVKKSINDYIKLKKKIQKYIDKKSKNKEEIKDLCPNCYLDFTEENGIEICNICGFKIDENYKHFDRDELDYFVVAKKPIKE